MERPGILGALLNQVSACTSIRWLEMPTSATLPLFVPCPCYMCMKAREEENDLNYPAPISTMYHYL